MDVDAIWLSPTQRADYMKKGLCFIHRKHGHHSGDHKKGKVPFDKDSHTSSPKVCKAGIPSTSDHISVFTAGLKKKNISQKKILDVLKMCFDDSEEGTKEEQVPVSRVSLGSSF
ncbi:hypothetical protein PAXINDRAFT_15714 [Paxillus involutus ATCC 200175]|uniref:Uncharacterized protein n=1 Tax=Paxillus involutus ATCC 200175 TaxID=664439 RepID=A0A0C9TL73_PAXIN|nr:hypothetical protein PAXINDRAFT_15714 [Paxillus involutus ATCC 200175]